MPLVDGEYHIELHLPQFYHETVDVSFSYPKCRKEYKKVNSWLNIPYPHCSKETKRISFDVPRIKWESTTINTRYGDKERFKEGVMKAVSAIIAAIDELKRERANVIAQFDAALTVARNHDDRSTIDYLEDKKEEILEEIDTQLVMLEEELEKQKAETA